MTLEELYRLLRSSHVQSQGVMDTLQEPLVVLDGSLTVVNANPAFFRTFKVERDDTLGRSLFQLGNGQWDIRELRTLLADVVPKAKAIVGYQVSHNFPDIGQRTMLLTARRLQHPDDNSTQMLLVFEDVTERQRVDAEKDLVLAETRHRMKNLLAILRAVAAQTDAKNRTAEEYRDVFMGRFEAILNAQMFVSDNGSEAELSAVIRQALEPVAGDRAIIEAGPPVVLAQYQVLPMSMMLHELATNALKYGALSQNGGTVHFGWKVEQRGDEELVRMSWQEEGGPPVSPPSRTGFGTGLIRNSVESEGGTIEIEYAATGLRARICLPLTH